MTGDPPDRRICFGTSIAHGSRQSQGRGSRNPTSAKIGQIWGTRHLLVREREVRYPGAHTALTIAGYRLVWVLAACDIKTKTGPKPPLAHRWARYAPARRETPPASPVQNAESPLAVVYLKLANSAPPVTVRHNPPLSVGRKDWSSSYWLITQERSACNHRALPRASFPKHPPPLAELTLAPPSE